MGEVARRSGLSVRTLHHYDAIGLVQPSGRNESGYRLYNAQDIERLHSVLSLKKLGLSLEAIRVVLTQQGIDPLKLIQDQINIADRTLEQAQALKNSLIFLQDTLLNNTDTQPQDTTHALLESVRLLTTYQKFLPIANLRKLLRKWHQARPRWEPLAKALAQCQRADTAVETPEVQRLTQQWMNVAMTVFGGELTRILQWAQMHRSAPDTAIHAGLDPRLLAYLEQAIYVRLTAFERHLSAEDLARLDGSLGPEWEKFSRDGQALMAEGISPNTSQAAALRLRYQDLLARTVRHDAMLGERMRQAYLAEPILAHGHFVSPELRAYLDQITS